MKSLLELVHMSTEVRFIEVFEPDKFMCLTSLPGKTCMGFAVACHIQVKFWPSQIPF